MHILNEIMHVVTGYRSLEESGRCTNTIVESLGLGVVSKLFEDDKALSVG